MSQKFLTPIDLSKLEIRNVALQNLASAPATPAVGQIYFDTGLGYAGVYGGATWKYLGQVDSVAAGDSTITVGGTAGAPTVKVAKALDHTYVTDFVATVEAVRLDQMAAPTASVGLNSQKITSLLDPTSPQDAASKNYVDNTAQGLSAKGSVTCATTAALPNGTAVYANGASGVGATLTAQNNGLLGALDGYTPVANDRILVKNEATTAYNGVYTVTNVGSVGSKFVLTRAADMDDASEFVGGFVYVESGTVNASSGWVSTIPAGTAVVVGTTNVTFTQFSGAGGITAGNGLTKVGSTISVVPGSGIIADGVSTRIDPAVVVQKYTTLVGNGSATAITVTHSLGNEWVTVAIYDASTLAQVFADVTLVDANSLTVTFAVAPASNAYRVVVQG